MRDREQVEESVVWLNFQAGDEQAYSYIYTAYFQELYAFGLKITPDPNLVKDGIQELFVKLWRTKENLSQPVSIRPYLFQALRRLLLQERAKQKYTVSADWPQDYRFGVVLSHDLQLIDYQLTEARQQQLEQALKKLTKRQRDAIHLKFYGKLRYDEIAEIMEVTVKSVYNLISKALEALYQELNQANRLANTAGLLGWLLAYYATT